MYLENSNNVLVSIMLRRHPLDCKSKYHRLSVVRYKEVPPYGLGFKSVFHICVLTDIKSVFHIICVLTDKWRSKLNSTSYVEVGSMNMA